MDYSVAEASLTPGDIDYEVLESIYDHLDSFDSYDFVDPDPPVSTPSPVATPVSDPTSKPTLQPINIEDDKNPTCSSQDLSRVASKCNCYGKKPNKPWKDEKEYEKCVNKSLKKSESDCDFDEVIEYNDCDFSNNDNNGDNENNDNDIEDDSDNNTNQVECEVYLDKKQCKKRKNFCKWKKNQCIDKGRRLEGNLRQNWGNVYVDTACKAPSEYGIPDDAVLVVANANSCKFELKLANGLVKGYDVLL